MLETKQTDTYSCLACCAVMITGGTLQDLHNFVGHDGSAKDVNSDHIEEYEGFSNYDVTMYLLYKGYWSGNELEVKNTKLIKPNEPFSLEVSLEKMKAIITVKNQRLNDTTHAIYWDGYKIYDPNPRIISDMMKLSDYTLLNIIFVEKFPYLELIRWKKRHPSV